MDTIDRGATLYYNFQGNRDGSARSKKEIRYDRALWNSCAQLQIRLASVTRYPTAANASSPRADPYSGFGNIELRYSYNVVSPAFDHSLEGGVVLPTATNGVQNLATKIKLFYGTKWKLSGWAVSYTNEYDQSVIQPPGSRGTSYYEGKLTVPNGAVFVPNVRVSAIYDYRVLFNQGSMVNSAAGAVVSGTFNDVGFNVYDTWGIGTHALWKYKFEASAVARL